MLTKLASLMLKESKTQYAPRISGLVLIVTAFSRLIALPHISTVFSISNPSD